MVAVRTALSLNLVDNVTCLLLSVAVVLRLFWKGAKMKSLPNNFVTVKMEGVSKDGVMMIWFRESD